MLIQNLSENVHMHVRNQRPFNGVSFIDKPYSGPYKLNLPDDDASAVEIRHPGRSERPAIQQGGTAKSLSIILSLLKDMSARELRAQEGLVHERVLHLLK